MRNPSREQKRLATEQQVEAWAREAVIHGDETQQRALISLLETLTTESDLALTARNAALGNSKALLDELCKTLRPGGPQ